MRVTLHNFVYSGKLSLKCRHSLPKLFMKSCVQTDDSFRQLVQKAPPAQPDFGTWLIFPSSGMVRLVGASSEKDAIASRDHLEHKWHVCVEEFVLTNYTVVGSLPVLTTPLPERPFHEFAQLCVSKLNGKYNPELINYVTIPFEDGVTCNIFYTRKFVGMGLKDRDQLLRLIKFL